jgi:divalent metal cation (Fe/Co/Zn/Cd) transporter
VARTLALDRVAAIKSDVVDAITNEFPGATVTITTTPRALDDETILERVLHVSAVMRRPVHHITVQRIGKRLSVGLDLEVDGRLSLRAGHAIASKLEAEIERELGSNVEVETHLEPLDVQGLDGSDVTGTLAAKVSDTLALRAKEAAAIVGVHDVRVRQTTAGLVVNYHCYAKPDLSISDVHSLVDSIERKVRNDIPEIVRVVGHAEPAAPDGRT